MANISELRQRAAKSRQHTVSKVEEAMIDYAKSDTSMLSLAANGVNNNSPDDVIKQFAKNVSQNIVEVVTNPVNTFTDNCIQMGMSTRKIERAVIEVNALFNLTADSAAYEDKLEAVALYIEENPHLYGDLVALVGARQKS